VLAAVRAASRILDSRAPRAVVSFGGYAAGPGGIAARLRRTPLIVHEQNRAPGMTNRVLARFAQRVLTGFPQTFRRGNEEVVGNPVRGEIAMLPEPAQRLGGHNGALRLLVLGGSQGARALNAAMPKALAGLRGAIEVRHQCGEKLREEAEHAYADAQIAASVEPFIADMAAAYAWADLVVCRAGALTLAELCAAGVGSLLVPFPQAVDDHQTRNAEYLVERGAALLLPQGESLADDLRHALSALAADPARRLAMAEAARRLAKPDAAEHVADIVLQASATPPRLQEAA
jgi:UDP-N-acetylglucosamine--N-acetylmuramyl-(pentapeptide) pyrophosphoryl-undecaprenol N-acetylglucosamine transferase